MTAQAGDVAQGFLWKQEHLAPLPIPTGQPASDLLNLIWRKNDVYLDIGSFAMGAGFITLHAGTFMFLFIALWVALDGDYVGALSFLVFFSCFLMIPLWSLFIRDWKKPLRPPLRFNRQRREVCVTEEDGNFWFVPWERVHAIAPSVTNLGTYGASKHGSLIIWLPLKGLEHEAYTPNTQGWVMMVNPGGGTSSMAQWECIRSFMEVGPNAVPESAHTEMLADVRKDGYLGIWGGLALQLWGELRAGKWASAFGSFCGLTIFGAPWIIGLQTQKLANIPDLTAPEAIEWSKPLPPEQWAKRSPELARAIAEREAELTTSGRAA